MDYIFIDYLVLPDLTPSSLCVLSDATTSIAATTSNVATNSTTVTTSLLISTHTTSFITPDSTGVQTGGMIACAIVAALLGLLVFGMCVYIIYLRK